jgi:putative hydrolase
MIDLHTHSLYSDGELVPAELWRRAQVKGYRYLAITDHVDASNFEVVFTRLKSAALSLNRGDYPVLIPGLEFTHLPPALIAPLTAQARALGVPLIVVHGESLAEPVAPGTNRAAIEADVDILAHPGLITVEEAARARERSIFLELSARKGHSLANGHVARVALEVGASLLVNTDAHGPRDLITRHQAERLARGAGLREPAVQTLFADAEALARRLAEL